MLEELAMVFGSRIVASEDVYPSTIEYRLHKIETVQAVKEVVAIVFDGEQEVHREYGKDYRQVIEHAKAWIDEQDESVDEFDLHTAVRHPFGSQG
ncbi:MAG: hypothetical protein R2932_10960 [Caldilineaceae bacterium]